MVCRRRLHELLAPLRVSPSRPCDAACYVDLSHRVLSDTAFAAAGRKYHCSRRALIALSVAADISKKCFPARCPADPLFQRRRPRLQDTHHRALLYGSSRRGCTRSLNVFSCQASFFRKPKEFIRLISSVGGRSAGFIPLLIQC